mmetsp:Transcript_37382/g.110354  ORF Transcript_37382/g.110354 Transcript_37382/m.110354 type:complete len:323 (-) Transcript_37382:834-1802(-)
MKKRGDRPFVSPCSGKPPPARHIRWPMPPMTSEPPLACHNTRPPPHMRSNPPPRRRGSLCGPSGASKPISCSSLEIASAALSLCVTNAPPPAPPARGRADAARRDADDARFADPLPASRLERSLAIVGSSGGPGGDGGPRSSSMWTTETTPGPDRPAPIRPASLAMADATAPRAAAAEPGRDALYVPAIAARFAPPAPAFFGEPSFPTLPPLLPPPPAETVILSARATYLRMYSRVASLRKACDGGFVRAAMCTRHERNSSYVSTVSLAACSPPLPPDGTVEYLKNAASHSLGVTIGECAELRMRAPARMSLVCESLQKSIH